LLRRRPDIDCLESLLELNASPWVSASGAEAPGFSDVEIVDIVSLGKTDIVLAIRTEGGLS
jgi:hypothetical protein